MPQPRVILIGGFLGAGKTTLIAAASRKLMRQGLTVGIVTNDQAADLVDTGLLQADTPDVNEVAGGCFCCRFDDFIAELRDLNTRLKPDILIGEPVGSCTDLSATVLQPLKKYYTDAFRTAPFSVLVDPSRFRESLAPRSQRSFPDSVLYIYRLQIEEADAIVINKIDQVSAEELASLTQTLAQRYPGRPIFPISALTGQGLDEWLDFVQTGQRAGQRITPVNYDTYADGEAVLGWLNASVRLAASSDIDWSAFCKSLLVEIRDALRAESAEIAHAKLLLTASGGMIAANLTGNRQDPSLRGQLRCSSPQQPTLVINIRAHIAPQRLSELLPTVLRAAGGDGISVEISHLQCFSPSRPQPTHRFDTVA